MSPRSLAFAVALLFTPAIAHADFNFVQLQGADAACKDPAGKTGSCPEAAFTYQRMSAGETDLQFFLLGGYRSIDGSKLHGQRYEYWDLGVGARWFPRAATFWLGPETPVRATGALSGGFGLNSKGTDYLAEVSGGLAVSGLKPRGFLLEGFFRFTENRTMPIGATKTHLTAAPHPGVRVSFFF